MYGFARPVFPSPPVSAAHSAVSWNACQTPGAALLWMLRAGTRSSANTTDVDVDWTPPIRTPRMARLEAVLTVADGPLSVRRLAQVARFADAAQVRRTIEMLNEAFDDTGCSFRVERVAGGYQLLTRPQFAPWLDRTHHRQATLKLSPAAMETLTIVAYEQPLTRADVEAIRGVQSSEMLKQLMERGLVRITGEDDSLGRPFLYGTTRRFLELFGVRNLDDLPMADRLRRPRADKATASADQNTDDEIESDDDHLDDDDELNDEVEDEELEDDEYDEDEDDDEWDEDEDDYDEDELEDEAA